MLALAWSAFLWQAGGYDGTLAGVRVSTNEPLRPLLIAAFAFSLFILSGGVWSSAARIGAVGRRTPPVLWAIGLAASVTAAGFIFSTTAASGSDSFGYVSQADRWLQGNPRIEQPFMAEIPWPSRLWSFAPLGYRPIEEPGQWAIVPTYSAGLPLIMAAAKWVGGQCALFAIVPISGGLFVLATYGLGRRFGSPAVGLIAAWLVATSPALLFMLMWPMTDVPVAAAWAISLYFLFGHRRRDVAFSGVAAAIAVMIRPNLVVLVPILAMWYVVRRNRTDGTEVGVPLRSDLRPLRDLVLFSLAVAPGVAITAAVNNYLYGSPLTSGYGGLSGMFDAANVVPNLQRYFRWFAESHAYVPLVGMAALFVPARWLWSREASEGRDNRRGLWIAVAFTVALWGLYVTYLVFEEWWYLRFVLASWPFIMIGVGAVAVALLRRRHPLVSMLVIGTITGVGIANYRYAISQSAFELWQGERRYVSAGRLVGHVTEPTSVIFSLQHSGSVRYYSGRISLRFDNLDRDWLDRAVAWLDSRGVSSYLLVEDWEEPQFRRHFAGQARVAHLDRPPIFLYEGPAKIALYDLTRARPPESPVQTIVETYRKTHCVPPAAPHAGAPWQR